MTKKKKTATSPNVEKKKAAAERRKREIRGIYLGSEQEVYEIERHAALSGAGSVSALIRILNNRLKSQYRDRVTLLEESILIAAQDGNNELDGLWEDLRVEYEGLSKEKLKCALISLTRRDLLIEASRGGKTENARGAVTRCWFPKGHKLGSDFFLSRPQIMDED